MAPVEKGEPWGEAGALPPDALTVRSDGEARAALEAARRAHRPFPVLGLLGGDLCRNLGGTGDAERLRSPLAMTFRVDVGEALLDGRLHFFVAHLVARTPLWGRTLAVMNAQRRDEWILAPRAHPGDGLLDVYEAELPVLARLAVRSRASHGTHLPHPGITERRVPAVQVTVPRPVRVELDGVSAGRARAISVRLMPEALTVVV
jgi:YegS C-terminal NAD kinase beta sandwich-like domain